MELNEQTLEHILIRQREEYERYMGALAEGLRSDIRAIADGHLGLQEQIKEQREEFQRSLTALADDLGGAIRSLFEILRDVRRDVEMMKTDIEIMKSELSIIRRDLKQKAGRDELAVLEARVAILEQSARAR